MPMSLSVKEIKIGIVKHYSYFQINSIAKVRSDNLTLTHHKNDNLRREWLQ